MVNNYTYINKANNDLSSQIFKPRKHYDIWHWKSGSGLEQAHKSVCFDHLSKL